MSRIEDKVIPVPNFAIPQINLEMIQILQGMEERLYRM